LHEPALRLTEILHKVLNLNIKFANTDFKDITFEKFFFADNGSTAVEIAIKNQEVVFQPLETIKGLSLKDAWLIVDEAEDVSIEDMQKIITRTGENCKLILAGDIGQSELKEYSGLKFLLEAIRNDLDLQSYSAVVEFDKDDIVRSDLCKAWIKYFYNNNL
jgi:phosphate starvation-inducible PhoH-like protein